MRAAQAAAGRDRTVERQGNDVDLPLAQFFDHPRVVGVDDDAALLEDQPVGRQPVGFVDRDLDLVPVAQGHRQAVYELRRAIDQQAGLDQGHGTIEVQHV